MPRVIFSHAQRKWTRGDESVDIDAKRVDGLIRTLYETYPELEGKLERASISIAGVIHRDARYVSLEPEAEIHFVGAIAGGSGDSVREQTPQSKGVLELARSWHAAGHGAALATVIETWGSSPCPPGSQLAIHENGHFAGSVSGGCVEGAVIESAQRVIVDRSPVLLEFGVLDEDAWAVGLACGGRVRIYVEPLD
jgi:XdhC and CoxI family